MSRGGDLHEFSESGTGQCQWVVLIGSGQGTGGPGSRAGASIPRADTELETNTIAFSFMQSDWDLKCLQF